MTMLKSCLIALTSTLFCIWLLRPLAVRIGFVDRPGGRKQHDHEVPLIGGIAMFFGFSLSLLSLHVSLANYRGLIAGSLILMMMGVVDDFRELSSKLRICGQIIAALLLVIWGGLTVDNLGNIFSLGHFQLGMWSLPLTVLVVVAFINAMNMVDGQDGLAGGIALGQVLLLGWLSASLHRHIDTSMLLIIAVLLGVFLSFNMHFPWRKRALIFMGDSGVTFIAFLIAWFAVGLSQANVHLLKPITVVWILAFPLFDLVNVSLYRIRQGKSPLIAGRDHLHHVLKLKGIDASISTLLLCILSLSLGLVGILLNHYNVNDGYQSLALLLALSMYLLLVKIARVPQEGV